jgi:hypothetical protein
VSSSARVGAIPLGEDALHAERAGDHHQGERRRRHGQRALLTADEARCPLPPRVLVGADDLTGLEAPEVLGELLRRRVALRRIARHRLADEGQEILGDARLSLLQGRRRSVKHLAEDRGLVRAVVGRGAAQDLIEDRSQGVDIGALIHGQAGGLLGRHVLLAERTDEDVGGLEVAVDDPLAVGIGHRLGGREDMRQEPEARLQRRPLCDQGVEGPA